MLINAFSTYRDSCQLSTYYEFGRFDFMNSPEQKLWEIKLDKVVLENHALTLCKKEKKWYTLTILSNYMNLVKSSCLKIATIKFQLS